VKSYATNFEQCEVDTPWRFGLSDWLSVLKRTWKEAHQDNVSVIAAGVAFFSLLAVFPLTTAALSTVSYFVDPEDVQGIMDNFASLLPTEAYGILDNQITSVLSAPPNAASFGIILSLSIALFSAGAGIRAMMRAMNVAYEEVMPGIIFALISWLSICFGFSKFVTHFGSYNEIFGGIASVIILLIWFWLTAMVVIIGAELNSELERQTLVDTTRGPCRPLGQRGAFVADFVARETPQERIQEMTELN
jgi:membrane protein